MEVLNKNAHLIELFQNVPKDEVTKTELRVFKCYDIEIDTAYLSS